MEGDRTALYLDYDGSHMTMHLLKLIEPYTKKRTLLYINFKINPNKHTHPKKGGGFSLSHLSAHKRLYICNNTGNVFCLPLSQRWCSLGEKGIREWNSAKFLLNSYKCILAVAPVYLKHDFFSALCLHIYTSHGKPLTTYKDKVQQGWDPQWSRHSGRQHQKCHLWQMNLDRIFWHSHQKLVTRYQAQQSDLQYQVSKLLQSLII